MKHEMKHEMKTMKNEARDHHSMKKARMEESHQHGEHHKQSDKGLLDVTLEGSGRSQYPKNCKLNHLGY